jgi:hypothetical protein
MFRFRGPRVLIGLLLALSAGAILAQAKDAFPGERRKWRHYQSPNFELYSGNSDRESRELLYQLELVHATFLEFFNLKIRLPLPVTVFYFGDEDDFGAYAPANYGKENRFAGFYVARADRSTILMKPREELKQALQTIVHEYVHHLFRITEERPPTWFNEGMAELFSTLDEEFGKIVLGRAKPGRVAELQREGLMSFDELFAVTHSSPVFRTGTHTGKFYAQSWALLHFCYVGMSDLPRDKLELFLRVARSPRLADDPARVKEIFQQLLGMDYEDLKVQVARYVRSGRYQGRLLPMPAGVPEAKSFVRREVAAEEITVRLAELAVRVNRSPEGKLVLLQAAERNPADLRLHETLGMLALAEGDGIGARERWERAVAGETANPAIYHELARLMTSRLMANFDPHYRMPEEMSARLRALLRRSITAAPDQTAAYETLAWIEGASAECDVPNVNLVQEHFLKLKRKDHTLVYLAMVRHRRGDNPAALQLLDDLPKLEPDDWSLRAGEVLRAKVEGRKPAPGPRPSRSPSSKPPPVRIKINPEAMRGPGTD